MNKPAMHSIPFVFATVLSLGGSKGLGQQEPCDFHVNLTSAADVHIAARPASTTGVTVLQQPGSPVEIVFVDVSGLAIAASDNGFSYHSDAPVGVDVRNRSDRTIDSVSVSVLVGTCHQVGPQGSLTRPRRPDLAPGERAHLDGPDGGGGGVFSAASDLRVFVWISQIGFGTCVYRPAIALTCPDR